MNEELGLALLNNTYAATRYIRTLQLRRTLIRQNERMEIFNELLKHTVAAMGLSSADFQYLLSLIEPRIRRQDVYMRDGITAREKLIITLRFLASGDSYKSMERYHRVPQQSIAMFVPQVCDYLVMFLRKCVKLPSTRKEWLKVSEAFERKFGFPHAIGSIGGHHVAIKAPADSGMGYRNCYNFSSIVVFAVVDANNNFMSVNIGGKGGTHPSILFRKTLLSTKLVKDKLNIPKADVLRDTSSVPVPYMLLGNEVFEFTNYCIRPFPGVPEPGTAEFAFNDRHSNAHQTFDTAFGILTNRFRVLYKTSELRPEITRKIVLACVYLHNFIRRHKAAQRCDDEKVECFLSELLDIPDYTTNELKNVRLHLATEFVNDTL